MDEVTTLNGMTAICEFCRTINLQCSEVTILSLIMKSGFPARKLGGQWSSDKKLIRQWHVDYILNGSELSPKMSRKISKKIGGGTPPKRP